jgi:lysophospholipase L1-like esterase
MAGIDRLLKSEAPLRWLFTGDSITHGALHTFGARDYVQHFEERLRYELGRPKDHVIRTAISGYISMRILEDIEWHILQYNPHFVSIMLGMNDSKYPMEDFDRDYARILDILAEKTDAVVVLHTPNPAIPGSEPLREPSLPIIAERIRAFGKERGLTVVDHRALWEKVWQENPKLARSWMNDSQHPNGTGHKVFAKLTFQTLGMWTTESKLCKLLDE